MHRIEEVLFWHMALQMHLGPVSMACNDNSGQGEYRRERDFLQILTAEEGSAGREGARLEGGVPLPRKRTSSTSLPLISLEPLMLCSFWRKRHYRSVCGLWLQQVIQRSEMNRKTRRTLKYFLSVFKSQELLVGAGLFFSFLFAFRFIYDYRGSLG